MPVDADIKDAGALAGFTRWGWPWHGVIAGGTIGSTGKAHTQPASNVSWLIDRSLPALEITPEEIAAYATMNMEWRTYALLPRGYVHNTAIGTDSYIHVDEAGACWRVQLTFSFPSTDTLRVSATLTRFGVITLGGLPAAASVSLVADVACTQIELADANTMLLFLDAVYVSRSVDLQDVYTNGTKALVGVMMTDTTSCKDMLSLVEVTISGIGGVDGAGLAMAAVEIMGQPDLTLGYVSIGGYPNNIYTRYAYYKSGVPTAISINSCNLPIAEGIFNGYVLRENGVVVDYAGWTQSSSIPIGSLAPYFPSGSLVGSNSGMGFIWRAFRNANEVFNYTEDIEINVDVFGTVTFSGKVLGLHRMPTGAVAFTMTGTEDHYGTVMTSLGNLTLADAPNANMQFACNRKTGDYTFATNAICYI